jgi:CheY-like chemotaxis protein
MVLTCLVVCAEAQALQVLDRILRDLGMETEHSADFAEADQRLHANRFDAVILDCADEQGASGLVASLRKTSANRTALVVAMVDSQNNVREVFAKGANFVLYKPIIPERAATSLRAARGLMRRERRRNQRIPVSGSAAITYTNVEDANAVLTDVSEEGIAIHSERQVPPSCKVYFQFSLPGQVSTIRLSGEVMWQDSVGRVGLRFADVPQTSRRALAEWLRANVSRIPEPELDPSAATAKKPAEHPRGLGLLNVSSADRREKSRLACRLSADIYQSGSNVPNRCTLSDVSSGGCYVETTAPFKSGTSVDIVVRTADLKLRVRGTVQAMHPGFGMGVAFNLATTEEREQVRQLVACQSADLGVSSELR